MASLIPFERFTLQTYLTPDQIRQRLSTEVEAGTFKGEIQANQFKIGRVIYYKNSFKPVIKGVLSQEMGITKIQVTMMPHLLVVLFIIFWLGFSGSCFALALAGWVFGDSVVVFYEPPEKVVAELGSVFGFGYTLSVLGFNIESIKTKKCLKELFEVI